MKNAEDWICAKKTMRCSVRLSNGWRAGSRRQATCSSEGTHYFLVTVQHVLTGHGFARLVNKAKAMRKEGIHVIKMFVETEQLVSRVER